MRRSHARDQAEAGNFDSLDMLLMHHYITSTARNLVGPNEAQDIWQDVVPVKAYAHPMLMHGILSLAGADLARRYYSPTSSADQGEARGLCAKYRARALSHQHAGLGLFQKALASKLDLPQRDIPPLVLFNLVLIIATFALPLTDQDGISMEDLLSLFTLCRGGKEVFNSLHDASMKQPLKNMMMVGDVSLLHYDIQKKLKTGIETESAHQDTFDKLINYQRFCQDSVLDIRTVCHWPSMCSGAFVEDVKQLKADALVIMAQYSHVLHVCRSRWWISEWAEMLLRAIHTSLSEEDKTRVGWNLGERLSELQMVQMESVVL